MFLWLLITDLPLLMSSSLPLLVWIPLCHFSWGESQLGSPEAQRQPRVRDILIYQSNKKYKTNSPSVRAILTFCISTVSDKSLMNWHTHKIDQSFKDQTSNLHALDLYNQKSLILYLPLSKLMLSDWFQVMSNAIQINFRSEPCMWLVISHNEHALYIALPQLFQHCMAMQGLLQKLFVGVFNVLIQMSRI